MRGHVDSAGTEAELTDLEMELSGRDSDTTSLPDVIPGYPPLAIIAQRRRDRFDRRFLMLKRSFVANDHVLAVRCAGQLVV